MTIHSEPARKPYVFPRKKALCQEAPLLTQDERDAQAEANRLEFFGGSPYPKSTYSLQRLCGNRFCIEGSHATFGLDYWRVCDTLSQQDKIRLDAVWAERVKHFRTYMADRLMRDSMGNLDRFDDTLADLDNLTDEELLARLSSL